MLSGEGMRLSRVRENLKHGSLRGWRKRTGANTIRRQLLKAAWLSIDGPGDEEPTSEARLHPTRHILAPALEGREKICASPGPRP